MKEENKKIVTIKVKRNKHRRYSYVNAIDELLNKYYSVYENLTNHTEGCISAEIYDKINLLLVEDYNNSINNLEYLSKKSMKWLNKRQKQENSTIFWYKFRRFFGAKINNEIEDLIKKKEQYNLEMSKLFEDLISANVRRLVESPEDLEMLENEEPDYCDDPEKLIEGPPENRSLHGEIMPVEDVKQLSLTGNEQNNIKLLE